MHMVTWDWVVIGIYFLVTIGVGLGFSHAAGKGVEDFFLAGRKLTWWLAGGSMVATMFASDTPLFHCGNVRDHGLSAGWVFILPMFGALAAAAVFARLVRRTRVVTDAEFVELRYSGNAPAPFRGFLAVYSGIFVVALTMGWVTLGMVQVTSQILGWDKLYSVIIVLGVVTVYSMASGLWGVVMTDMFQYIVAALGSLFLAIMAVNYCGGLDGLRTAIAAIPGYSGADMHFLPTGKEVVYSTKTLFMTWPVLISWLIVQNIAQASSTAHQGQRVLACRTEKDASLTYVFYSICYYAVNGLSWIIVGLASVVVLGATNQAAGLSASEKAFPAMINKLMPVGLKGLMVASIFAAFMSTVSVLLNWGGSYLVNDLYRRFMVRTATQKHYVKVSRLASLLLGVLGAVVCMQFDSLKDMFSMVGPLLTGGVVVLLARYMWWRTNIWSEVSAMVASPIVGFYVEFVLGARNQYEWLKWVPGYGVWYSENGWLFYGHRLLAAVGITTAIWIIVTFLTKPTEMEKLKAFYRQVRPTGPGWWYVRRRMDDAPPVESALTQLWVWATSVTFVLGAIVTVVCVLQGRVAWAIVWGVLALLGAWAMSRGLNKLDINALAHEDEANAIAEAADAAKQ